MSRKQNHNQLKSQPSFNNLTPTFDNKKVDESTSITQYEFRQLIAHSLKSLFGECGASIQVDILKYQENNHRAILRCLAEFYVKVRAALTLLAKYTDKDFCVVHVIKSSPVLLSLLGNSRNFKHTED